MLVHPARSSGDGVVIVGDAAGLVDVPSLKGIHYAVQSGIYAARAIFAALKAGDASADVLAEYDRLLNQSYVVSDLYPHAQHAARVQGRILEGWGQGGAE